MPRASDNINPESDAPKLQAFIEPANNFSLLKSRLAKQGETIKEWTNRVVRLELAGKLPKPNKKQN